MQARVGGRAARLTSDARSSARLRLRPGTGRGTTNANNQKSKTFSVREIVIAVIGIIGTLTAAGLGSWTTVYVATNQSRTEAERSAEQFRKDKQTTMYSDYGISLIHLYNAEDDLLVALEGQDPDESATEDEIMPAFAAYLNTFDDFAEIGLTIRLFATMSMNGVLNEIAENVNTVYGDLNDLVDAASTGRPFGEAFARWMNNGTAVSRLTSNSWR